MNQMLVTAEPRLTYLRDPMADPRAFAMLDLERIRLDLSEGVPAEVVAGWRFCHPLAEHDHLVIAEDPVNQRVLGVLGALELATAREPFLLMETAFVIPRLRGQRLMRRMMALVMLRAAGSGPIPQVLAARTASPAWYRTLRAFAARFPGAVFYPEPADGVISLATAGLARRIAREVCARLRFDPGTGALRGARAVCGQGWTTPEAAPADPAIAALFQQVLRPADQVLSVVDLRRMTEDTVTNEARRIWRAR